MLYTLCGVGADVQRYGLAVLIGPNRTMDNVQKHNICIKCILLPNNSVSIETSLMDWITEDSVL
jgi:hypothetical protein